MGHSTSRSSTSRTHRIARSSTSSSKRGTRMSESHIRSITSSPPSGKPIPSYILDSLRDPELLTDHWYALADLEEQRQRAGQESLIRTRYAKPPEIARYSIAHAGSPENKKKNRYQNVAPYDLNAVRVGEGVPGNEEMYLNASWVRERAGGVLWIASQVSNAIRVVGCLTK